MLVIKYGGNAMKSENLRKAIALEIAALRTEYAVVVVHGGGPIIEANLKARGLVSEFKRGMRVTSSEVMEVIELCMTKLSKELAQDLGNAVGLSGRDSNLLVGVALEPLELGRAGKVNTVNVDLLRALLKAGYTPVVGCLGVDAAGEALNVNADWVAGVVAGALECPILYLSDVDGVYRNYPDPSSLALTLEVAQIRQGIAEGWISGGMIPKVEAALYALERGASSATIASGMQAGVLAEAVVGRAGTRIIP
jgi:acetylglutamate kinase